MIVRHFTSLASWSSMCVAQGINRAGTAPKRHHRTWLKTLASRLYPQEPRVGVGVIVFRPSQSRFSDVPDVLVVRRAKEPSKGKWSFPGETLVQCACREVAEETGILLRSSDRASTNNSSLSLNVPRAFAAFDSITHDKDGRVAFQYVIVEVAAVAADPAAQPSPTDDVDDAKWVSIDELSTMPNLTSQCVRLTFEALDRFDLGFPYSMPAPVAVNTSCVSYADS